jgi:tRNA threonylcarbamoyladenosine biosynthesis protein TsaE
MARLPFVVVRTRSPEQTRTIAKRIGELSLPGDVLLLQGTLGTGKTTFVQGLAEGLEVPDACRSPTFTMVHHHEGGRYPLLHMDLFRCENPQEVLDLGLEELLEGEDLAVLLRRERAQLDAANTLQRACARFYDELRAQLAGGPSQ